MRRAFARSRAVSSAVPASRRNRTRTAADERWLEILAEPCAGPKGAVVTLLDITHHKRDEFEAGRLREDLAHLTRVSTLGQLAASLAHELNQPLAAILANVQAAQMLMRRPSPDLDEVREILSEVVTDDKRAGEIIRRLGALFKKGARERVPLDVNELIQEVLRMLHNDIVLRGASLRADLAKGLPLVEGDRIQLQRVVLTSPSLRCDDRPAGGPASSTIGRAWTRRRCGSRWRTRAGASTRRTGSGSSSLLYDQAHGHGHGPGHRASIVEAHGSLRGQPSGRASSGDVPDRLEIALRPRPIRAAVAPLISCDLALATRLSKSTSSWAAEAAFRLRRASTIGAPVSHWARA